MNKYVKSYLHRGLIFSGLGPIVLAIVYLIIDITGTPVELTALDVFKGVISTYIIAFVHAGSSIFPQMEKWPRMKCIFWQGLSIYLVYLIGYLVNSWIPLNIWVILLYTGCFIVAFAATWIMAIIISNKSAKKMNEKLKEINK